MLACATHYNIVVYNADVLLEQEVRVEWGLCGVCVGAVWCLCGVCVVSVWGCVVSVWC